MKQRVKSRPWTVASVVLAFIVVATGLGIGSTMLAVGPGTFVKVSDTYYRDPNCGGTDPFVVDTWTDAGYTGIRIKFCSSYPDFCNIWNGIDSSSAALCSSIGLDAGTANDRISSVKVVEVNGGASCYVQFRDNADYTGAQWIAYDPKNDSDLGPVWPNDTWSSVRRVC